MEPYGTKIRLKIGPKLGQKSIENRTKKDQKQTENKTKNEADPKKISQSHFAKF